MPDDPRIQELLDELLDRDATPEEVCGACPELLPAVRERWRQICRMRAELDAMFPVWPNGILPTMPPEELPLPQVPGYEVEAVLGHGGMGVVFRARHLRLGRLVALKMTLAGAYAGPHERERFRREAEAIAALRHANVVQVYDVGDWAGRPFFTMELIDGGSLAQRLTGAPQPARQAAALLATLAEAMHAAHQGRDRPPRPQARQHPVHARRHAQGHGFRARPAPRRRRGADPERRPAGHAELHGPRASTGPVAGGRAGRRCLRAGGDPLRAADGPAAVPRRDAGGDLAAGDRSRSRCRRHS